MAKKPSDKMPAFMKNDKVAPAKGGKGKPAPAKGKLPAFMKKGNTKGK